MSRVDVHSSDAETTVVPKRPSAISITLCSSIHESSYFAKGSGGPRRSSDDINAILERLRDLLYHRPRLLKAFQDAKEIWEEEKVDPVVTDEFRDDRIGCLKRMKKV